MAIEVTMRDGTTKIFDTDEHPRRGSTMEKLAALKPLHPEIENFPITAGNSSGLNDAAAAMMIVSSDYAKANGLTPLGRIVSDYGLMADLATFYGHVAELQWRLRFKAEPATAEDAINPLIDALVLVMLSDVEELLPQVRRQVVEPDVERVHGEAAGGTVVGRRQFTAAIRVVGK